MWHHWHDRIHRIPWFKLGALLGLVGLAVEFLQQLGEVDLTPLIIKWGGDPAMWFVYLGLIKIGLRMILIAFPPKPPHYEEEGQ